MKTERLIDLLSDDLQPVDASAASRRIALTVLLGGTAAFALMLACFGVNPELGTLLSTWVFWNKIAFAAALATAGFVLTVRLSRPDGGAGRAYSAIAVVLTLMWLLMIITLIQADSGQRLALLLGRTWRTCPFNIALLSAPIFVASAWTLQHMAPTRLRAAGAAAGVFSGAFGAFVYALHCPEMAPPFIGTWYVLGIAIPTAVGAALGPRLLRW